MRGFQGSDYDKWRCTEPPEEPDAPEDEGGDECMSCGAECCIGCGRCLGDDREVCDNAGCECPFPVRAGYAPEDRALDDAVERAQEGEDSAPPWETVRE